MLTAEVAHEFWQWAPGAITALEEAFAMDHAYGAGSWIEMVKHYEEEERFAVYNEGDFAERRLCPACRAQWEPVRPDFITLTGWTQEHEANCAYVEWRNMVNEDA